MKKIELPNCPALIAEVSKNYILSPEGEILELGSRETIKHIGNKPVILCNKKTNASHLKINKIKAFDILELFAFCKPAFFAIPTIKGIAKALKLVEPKNKEQELLTLFGITRKLIEDIATSPLAEKKQIISILYPLKAGEWPWADYLLACLDASLEVPHSSTLYSGLKVIDKLKEWSEYAPEPPAGNVPVSTNEARERLYKLLSKSSDFVEDRQEQSDYSSSVSFAFTPRDSEVSPNLVLAEAGTGVGKTLGYIAPASIWAEKNEASVWISTYTKNLQRQVDIELDKLCTDKITKRRKVVVRKGRENYCCLLNFEDAILKLFNRPKDALALGIMARWLTKTRDGDMVGGDFQGWLIDLLGRNKIMSLTDHRGECIYASCPHYKKCFVESTVRRARRADIVVANHALVMLQAMLGAINDNQAPTRYIFDEGHHLFNSADSAFCANFSAFETNELRRWLRGAEDKNSKSRAKGLKRRLQEIVAGNIKAEIALKKAVSAAECLPSSMWQKRIVSNEPFGEIEKFFALVRKQVLARNNDQTSFYNQECEIFPVTDDIKSVIGKVYSCLDEILTPIKELIKELGKMLKNNLKDLETNDRMRVEALINSIEKRCLLPVSAWQSMLCSIEDEKTEPDFVDWFEIEKIEGKEFDFGMHRHWIDPTKPFAKALCETSQGVVITSATLKDRTNDNQSDWDNAFKQTGAFHVSELDGASMPIKASFSSPFDYQNQTKVVIVQDINKNDIDQVSNAYKELFLASNGGALGIFTAISRLKKTYEKVSQYLFDNDIKLYAQHADAMDTSTLIDIFRAEENSCLLGTDAVRDGVDVPGRSLRQIVFDRIPWPRPDILHKKRANYFGKTKYNDMLTRMKLAQAYGRLVRKKDDKGIFVMLDRSTPSRLYSAFPEGVEILKIGIKETIELVKNFNKDY